MIAAGGGAIGRLGGSGDGGRRAMGGLAVVLTLAQLSAEFDVGAELVLGVIRAASLPLPLRPRGPTKSLESRANLSEHCSAFLSLDTTQSGARMAPKTPVRIAM